VGSGTGDSSAAAMNDIEAEEGRNKEEDGCQEEKSDIGLELRALTLSGYAVPVPDTPAIHGADKVDEKTEGNHEEDKHDKVDWPVDEGRCERDQEHESDQDAESGDDLSVDKALLIPCSDSFNGMEILAGKPSYSR